MKMSWYTSLHHLSASVMRHLGRLALAMLLALGALPIYPATPILADSAVIFNVSPYSNPTSIPASDAPRLVISSLAKGPGLFKDSYFNGVKAGFLAAAGWTTSSTRNASDYIQFTVTAANRFSIDYNSITYGLFVQDSGNPSDYKGPRTWELRYSLDGFASDDHSLATHSNSYSNASALVQTTYTTDLSSIGTTNETVTFRLYGYYSQGSETGSAGGFAISSGATYKPYLNWTGTGSNVILDYTPIETTPNTAPVVSDFAKEGAENETLQLAKTDFSGHYSDSDGEAMTKVKIVALPANGTLTLNGSNVTTGQEIAANDLDTLDFTPDPGWSGTTTFDWNASDGDLYATSDATATLGLQAMNDAPINSVPGPQTANEDTDTLLGAISVSDTDAGDGQIRTTLSVAHGTLTVTTGNATVSNNGTASVRLDGILTQVNATLAAGVTYRGDSDYDGADTLTVTTNDNGNTGNGGAQSDTDTVSITVDGTQDAPTVADFSMSGSEDNAITFAESDFANTFDDPDTGDSLQTVRIDTLPAQGGLQLNGSDVSLNQEIAAGDLGNLRYSPDADRNGSDSFDWNGSDGTEYASVGATVSITVTAVNDGPVNSVPGPQTVDEDTNLSIAGLSVSDVDAGSNDVQTTLAASHGVVTITTNLPGGVSAGDVTGNGTASVVISGTLSEINTTLGDGVTYRGEQDYSGPDTLTMTTNDQGHTGSGGASSDVDTVNITVNPVPDAPIVGDFGKTTNEDTTLSFAQSDFENAYYDGDADALATVRIDSLPAHGDLQLNGSDVSLNQEIAAGDLGNLTYSPDANWNGSDSFDWNGSDGSAYASASATVEITVTAVNDAPVNSVPGAQTVDEDTDLDIEGLSISDLDAGSNNVQTTLAVGHGVVTVTTNLPGGAPAGDITGNGTASVVVNGTLSEINTTLGDGITYRGTLNYHGADSLTMTTNDQGHSGNGDPLSDTDTMNITVDSVPDTPVVEDFGKSTSEDTLVSFAASSDFESHFSDGDNDSISAVRIDSLPAHGTLQVSGSDVTAHQEIPAGELNNLAYIPDANWNGADSFDWNAYDGSLYAESNATITISVSAVNDAPIQTVPGVQMVDEDTDLNIAGLSISDVDAGASDIQTTLNVTNGVIMVTVDLPGGVPAGDVTGNGTANVTISSSLSEINTSLGDGVTYRGALNYHGADMLTMTINDQGHSGDGGPLGDTDTVNITVDSVPDAPVVEDFGKSTNEDTPVSFAASSDFESHFSDGDNDSLVAVRIDSLPAHGTLQVSGSDVTAHQEIPAGELNNLSYTPDADWNGADSFAWNAYDGSLYGESNATITITVSAVNDAPAVADFDKSGNEDTPIDFTAGDFTTHTTDVDIGDSVETVQINSLPTHGTLKLAGPNVTLNQVIPAGQLDDLTYTPDQNWSGADEFDWNASDGDTYASTDATVDITIDALNDPPVNSVPGPQTVNEDSDLVFRSSNGNAISTSDLDAETATISTQLSVNHGTLTVGASDATVTGNGTAALTIVGAQSQISITLGTGVIYRASQDYNGADTLTVTTDDMDHNGAGGAQTDIDTVSITVNSVNDAPVVANFDKSGDEDTPIDFTDDDFTTHTTDIDIGDSVETVQITSLPAHGTLKLDGSNVTLNQEIPAGQLSDLTYTSDQNWFGVDEFDWNASDGDTYASTDATVDITIDTLNDPPVNSVPGSQTGNEDADLVFRSSNGNGLSISDPDAEDETISTQLSVNHGTLNVDVSGAGVTGNGTATVTIVGAQSQISITLGAGVTYHANQDYNGADTLTMTTDDMGNSGAGGAKTDVDTISITVTAVNDAPVNSLPAPQTVKEDAQLVFDGDLAVSVADLDAGSSDVQVTLTVTHGVLTLGQTAGLAFSAGDGTADAAMTFSGTLTDVNAALDGLAYLANKDYNGADTLSVTSNDLGHTGIGGALADTDSIGIIVTPVNDPPVNSVPGLQQVNEEENLLITGLGVSDVDAASDDVVVTLGARHGVLTVGSGAPGGPIITGNGTYTVTLTGAVGDIDTLLSSGVTYLGDVDYFGADALTMSSDDLGHNGESPAGAGLHAAATGLTDSDTVAITVHNVNDPPVAVDDSVITDEDTLLRIRALSNDSDADGDALSVSAITQGAFGVVQIHSDGTILYSPFSEYFGLDSFTYTAADGNGASDTATITVTISAVNDPPVAEDDQATTQQDTAHDVAVLTNDSDMDGDILEVTGVTEPAHGTTEIIDGGLIRYTPADGFYGNDAFEYTVDDGQEGFDTATVRMTVIEIGGDEPPPPPTSITFQQGMGGYFGMEDTYLDLGNPTTPFGDTDRLRMKTTENADALFRFNLAVMPAGTTIQQASVRLFAIDHSGAVSHDPIPITLRVYPVLRDWDESQATWYSTGSDNWAAPGCQTAGVDYAPEYTAEVVAFDAVQDWIEFDITDLAQYWVDHPETNYGIVIKAYLHSETVSYSFWSSQGPLTALRPQLRLDYTLPHRP